MATKTFCDGCGVELDATNKTSLTIMRYTATTCAYVTVRDKYGFTKAEREIMERKG